MNNINKRRYKNVYHVSVSSDTYNSHTQGELQRLSKQKDIDNSLIVYYTDGDNDSINIQVEEERVKLLQKLFKNTTHGGSSNYNGYKDNVVSYSYFKQLWEHSKATHHIINLTEDICVYTDMIRRLLNINIVESHHLFHQKNYKNIVNSRWYVINNEILSFIDLVLDNYEKVLIVDTDNLQCTKLVDNIDNHHLFNCGKTLVINVGLVCYSGGNMVSNNNIFLSRVNLNNRTNVINLDINTSFLNFKLQEVVDNIIVLLSMFIIKKKREILILSLDTHYRVINKIVGKHKLTLFYSYITYSLTKASTIVGYKSRYKTGLLAYKDSVSDRLHNAEYGLSTEMLLLDTWGIDLSKCLYD